MGSQVKPGFRETRFGVAEVKNHWSPGDTSPWEPRDLGEPRLLTTAHSGRVPRRTGARQ